MCPFAAAALLLKSQPKQAKGGGKLKNGKVSNRIEMKGERADTHSLSFSPTVPNGTQWSERERRWSSSACRAAIHSSSSSGQSSACE